MAAVEQAGYAVHLVSTRDLPSTGTVSIGSATIALGHRQKVEVGHCVGVWLWHAEPPAASDADRQVARYVEGEWKLALNALASVVPTNRWVNHPRALNWWECNKIAQLEFARNFGFLVPETLLSNDRKTIVEFASRFDKVAVKAQAAVRLERSEGFATTFTQMCTAEELAKQGASLARAPVLVQPYLEKRMEIRATVVDSSVFLCEIDSQASERTRVDWRRYDFDRVAHRLIADDELERKLADFVEEAGLRYAAIDLLQTPTSEMYFLDLNPSGQFSWIEGLTGAPITDTIARALINGGRPT